MSQQFQTLRDKLRAADCELQCCNQVNGRRGHSFELWQIYRPAKPPIRIVAIDTRGDGYALFLENASLAIDDDVEAILNR